MHVAMGGVDVAERVNSPKPPHPISYNQNFHVTSQIQSRAGLYRWTLALLLTGLSLVPVQLLWVLPAEVPEDDPADLHALPGISHSAERGSGCQSGSAGSASLKWTPRLWEREQNHAGPGPADPPSPGDGLKLHLLVYKLFLRHRKMENTAVRLYVQNQNCKDHFEFYNKMCFFLI